MIINLLIAALLISVSLWLARSFAAMYPTTQYHIFRNLVLYHIVFTAVYYLYALANPSDSWAYYDKVLLNFRGDTWGSFYGVSTVFIEFLGYPFIKYLGFGYEGMMMLFSWFGLMGFFCFYVFLSEQIRFRHTVVGVNLLYIILFLPNLHFWSTSFGKGSIIFLGIGLFFFSLNRIERRFVTLILGGLIIYHVRPHILFIVLLGTTIGLSFSGKGTSWIVRVAVIAFALLAFNYIYQDVLQLVGIEEEEIFEESAQLTRRVRGLTRATSGVDITSYSFPMKLFTFLFRPLFFDAPGVLGLVVSFENLFYLFIFFRTFSFNFVSFVFRSGFVIKAAFISFFGISAALAQISANLGLAMRQKSQVMILMLFVIVKYMDTQKLARQQYAFRKRAAINQSLIGKTQ